MLCYLYEFSTRPAERLAGRQEGQNLSPRKNNGLLSLSIGNVPSLPFLPGVLQIAYQFAMYDEPSI
jgi:hypothetical protein